MGGPVAAPRPARQDAGRGRTVISVAVGAVLVILVAVAVTVAKDLLLSPSVPDSFSLTTPADGWNNDSNCAFKSDGYHISGAYICYAPSAQLGNGSVQVRVKQISGPTTAIFGLVFRRVSAGNFYSFTISSDGNWLAGVVTSNGSPKQLAGGASTAINTGLGAVNALEVTMSGTRFQFLINGTVVGSATDATFAKGDTGLSGDFNDDTGTDIVYTNFQISR